MADSDWLSPHPDLGFFDSLANFNNLHVLVYENPAIEPTSDFTLPISSKFPNRRRKKLGKKRNSFPFLPGA
jgi:hypothetical protein